MEARGSKDSQVKRVLVRLMDLLFSSSSFRCYRITHTPKNAEITSSAVWLRERDRKKKSLSQSTSQLRKKGIHFLLIMSSLDWLQVAKRQFHHLLLAGSINEWTNPSHKHRLSHRKVPRISQYQELILQLRKKLQLLPQGHRFDTRQKIQMEVTEPFLGQSASLQRKVCLIHH